MNTYAPYDFNDINIAQAHGQPNQVYLDSAIFKYWCRSLYQRMTSIFEWTVPESWQGKNKDFFNWLLFAQGYVGIINSEDYGYIFQPCQPGADRNIFYQVNSFIITNPYDSKISREYKKGVDIEILELTPDYMGVFDIIHHFASRLSYLYTAVNTSLLVCRNPRILASRSKTGAQALKIAMDKIISGDPFIIFDQQIMWPDAKTKEDALFDINPTPAKENYITTMLLEDEKTILKEFDSSVGIMNLDSSDGKKERLVTSEAEAQMTNSTAAAYAWYDCLKDSIDNIKRLFPDIDLDVKLRYQTQDINETTGGDENVPGSGDTERN